MTCNRVSNAAGFAILGGRAQAFNESCAVVAADTVLKAGVWYWDIRVDVDQFADLLIGVTTADKQQRDVSVDVSKRGKFALACGPGATCLYNCYEVCGCRFLVDNLLFKLLLIMGMIFFNDLLLLLLLLSFL